MSAQISLYGRLGQDPRAISTTTGKPMTVASVAVELRRNNEDSHTEWFNLVAFGKQAEELLRHSKGDLISALGTLQLNVYEDKNGDVHEQFQVVVQAVMSARTTRPATKKKNPQSVAEAVHEDFFDDPL